MKKLLCLVENKKMKIIKAVQSHLWNNKYSECSKDGAIIKWLEAIPSAKTLVVPHGDGVCSIKPYDTFVNNYVTLVNGDDTAIVGAICSRQPHPLKNKMLYLPLDDDIFIHGLKYVLARDVANPNIPWKERESVAYWRGVLWDFRKPFVLGLHGFKHANVLGVRTPWGKVEVDLKHIDTRYNGYNGRPVPLCEHFEYKYLLIMDGFMVASNLQWVFGSGSVPILITNTKNEYWFKKFIKPDVNCVVIDPEHPNAAKNLRDKIQFLVDNDNIAEQIANNAKFLSEKIFTPQFQQQYLIEALKELGAFE